MPYEHGVRVQERATGVASPLEGYAGLQVIFGTAPINLAENPTGVTNKPILVHSFDEAKKKLGYSEDFTSYTLCQSMYACFKLFGVGPAVFVNVLNPATHKTTNAAATATVTNLQAKITTKGILKSSVVVKDGDTTLDVGDDYTLSFDESGNLLIALTTTGAGASAATLTVESDSIDPTAVDADDIIGSLDAATGAETGLEVLRQVFPALGLVPGILLAPGWSHDPDVGIVLAAKCEEINGYFTCECLIDIDSTSTGCVVYTNVASAKASAGCTSEHAMALWPCVKSGTFTLWYSAVMGALIAYTDVKNDDVPNLSPSNKLLGITGTCLADGTTEVNLDQLQGNALNAVGVATAINVQGWRSWGNNTAAYPENTDPKDRWFCCRRFFSWWGNSFILTYFSKVDDPANQRLIEAIVDSENIRGASFVAQGKCAAASITYDPDENPVSDLLANRIVFRQKLAPYTPAEDILNTLEFDTTALEAALS